MLDERIYNRTEGYWPHSRLTPAAVKAWEHKLASFNAGQVLAVIDDYADEGHTRPPVAGQIVNRIIGDKPAHETEAQRCTRQRKQARRMVKAGKMAGEDYDYYQRTYWGKHIGGDRD